MSIEKTSQGFIISTMHDGYRVQRHYIGYTRAEALQLFKKWLKVHE